MPRLSLKGVFIHACYYPTQVFMLCEQWNSVELCSTVLNPLINHQEGCLMAPCTYAHECDFSVHMQCIMPLHISKNNISARTIKHVITKSCNNTLKQSTISDLTSQPLQTTKTRHNQSQNSREPVPVQVTNWSLIDHQNSPKQTTKTG